jgi:hypothetical protein
MPSGENGSLEGVRIGPRDYQMEIAFCSEPALPDRLTAMRTEGIRASFMAPFVVVAALFVGLAGLAGCSSGKDEPTVADAGGQLQRGVQRLYDAELGRGQPTVSNDANANQSCGDKRAKRVYSATVPSRGFNDRALAFDYAVGVLDDLGGGWERQSTNGSKDTVTTTGAGGHARISVITAADGTSYTISGETDCLPVG